MTKMTKQEIKNLTQTQLDSLFDEFMLEFMEISLACSEKEDFLLESTDCPYQTKMAEKFGADVYFRLYLGHLEEDEEKNFRKFEQELFQEFLKNYEK